MPARLVGRALAGSLPPAHVAARIRGYLAAGKPARWVSMCYILDADGCCIGGCGFKDVPHEREVEVGYGIAEPKRGQGYASAALAELVQLARASDEIDALVAYISHDNAASIAVVTRAGFLLQHASVMHEGELQLRFRLDLRAFRSADAAHCDAPG